MRVTASIKDSHQPIEGIQGGKSILNSAFRSATLAAALFASEDAAAQIPFFESSPLTPVYRTPFEKEEVLNILEGLKFHARRGSSLHLNGMPSDPLMLNALEAELRTFLDGPEPDGFNSQLVWHTAACVLRSVNFRASEEYEKRGEEYLKRYIESSRNWPQAENPITEADWHLRALRILSTMVPYDDRHYCLEEMQAIESGLLSQHAAELRREIIINAREAERYTNSVMTTWRQNAAYYISNDQSWFGLRDNIATRDGTKYYHPNGHSHSEEWEILAPDRYYPDGILFRRVDKIGPRLTLPTARVQELIRVGEMRTALDEAIDDFHANSNREYLRPLLQFDLPRGDRFVHLRIFPDKPDNVIDSCLVPSIALADAFKCRYGDAVECPPALYSFDPHGDLIKMLDKHYERGIRVFSVELNSHGSQHAIEFGYSFDVYDIRRILERYPDCRFLFSTIACYGGGLADELRGLPAELRDRCAFSFQTKPFVVNEITQVLPPTNIEIGGLANYRSSYFMLRFIELLHDPKISTLGEAFKITDDACSALLPFDPEVVLEGNLFSKSYFPGGDSLLLARR